MSRTLKCHDHHPTNGRKEAGPHCSFLRRAFRRFGYFSKHETGAAVLEFAFIAPVLVSFVAILGMIGIEVRDFIKVDQILTAGAAVAIGDPGDAAVVLRMRQVAVAHGYTIADSPVAPGDDRLMLQSARQCFCPNNPEPIADCTQICTDLRPSGVRYTLSAMLSSSLPYRLLSINNYFPALYPLFGAYPKMDKQVVVR